MDHSFSGTPFTIGIEEELMLMDEGTLDLAHGIEEILRDVDEEGPGQVKPELLQSVLEIATDPCPDLASAGGQLREIRARVNNAAERNGMLLGAAGTHPSAHWEDQRIVERPRYEELASELGWIARQELIFGTHVHVGVNGADRAIYVADGIRRHLPLLLAISANSPLWRGEVTGMMSTRTPIFRHFPRVGIPPHYGSWEIFDRRVEVMMAAGAIPDYTYLWWDVRPHPNLGTIEIRVYDQQTRLEDTVSLAALAVCLVHRYVGNFDEGKPLVEVPTELIDDNKVRAALRGLEGELVDLPHSRQAPALELALGLVDELEPDAADLGCEEELGGVRAIATEGSRARKQLDVLEREGMDGLIRHLCREVTA
ncbi:MAG TPA: YbdK family carboxylate-amine ligase [Solirubrobacterales bacterium]|nr:YbdK family carboxylate-amine ligase [Solirubrobacterales bacterium]